MTTTPLDQRSRVLDAAKAAVAARMQAEVDLLVAAAQWAVMHPATEATDYAGFGEDHLFAEALTPLAGEGAPLVAEFAPAELAAVLGWSTETVKELMGDALEVHCRLPGMWDDVLALRLPVSLARYAAEQTRDLDRHAAHDVDQRLRGGGKLTRRFIRRVVDDVRLHQDPDRAVAEEENALAARRVEVRPGNSPATLEIVADVDLPDGLAFDHTVSRVAERLEELGDTDDLDVRRARAAGILADPQAALDLLNGGGPQPSPRGGSATLFLHADMATLADLAVHGITGPVHDERWGTATTDLIREWLTGWLGPETKVKVQPWLDLAHPEDLRPVDGHDPTEAMIAFCRLRDRCWCSPAVPDPPAAAISTTSNRTSHPTTADRPARPTPTTSRRSAEATTGSRPTAAGATDACPTAATGGPRPPAAPSTYHPHDELATRPD